MFWTMFVFNFRKNLLRLIQAQNDTGQPLWAPKKYPRKIIKRGFFLDFWFKDKQDSF